METEEREICTYCQHGRPVAVTIDLGNFVVGWGTNRPRMCIVCADRTLRETCGGYIRTPSNGVVYKDNEGIIDVDGRILPCEFVTIPKTKWELVTAVEKSILNEMREKIRESQRPIQCPHCKKKHGQVITRNFHPVIMSSVLKAMRDAPKTI